MSGKDYVNRHRRIEIDLAIAVRNIQREVAIHLLNIIKIAKSSTSRSINQTSYLIRVEYDRMYSAIERGIKEFGEDISISNIKWESSGYSNSVELEKIIKMLFGSVLVSKNSLDAWLFVAKYKNYEKTISIIKRAIVNDLDEKVVEKELIKYYKNPLNNLRVIMDAIAFSSVFIVRDEIMMANNVELIQWISVLDKGTTKECQLRDSLVYYQKNKNPYMHTIGWKRPGVYHWGCRSFVVPYK